YGILSPAGKVYIGQSWYIKKRFSIYNRLDCKDQRLLYNSLKKYGVANHEFKIFHEFPPDVDQSVLNDYEKFYWQQYRDCGIIMLNCKQPDGFGGKHSDETKAKMKGRRAWNKGIPCSESAKIKA